MYLRSRQAVRCDALFTTLFYFSFSVNENAGSGALRRGGIVADRAVPSRGDPRRATRGAARASGRLINQH